ncbi:MAG: hypothetical protein CO108_16815 [Deltaproteobacteria bacterium CG_4_9_14_3_um_filter_63_12]|nr:MAG: hypothetical protein CO108_16815 [Deltaproteobacteria bacterium CG_4_9_14_3_um_filter_63_12]
MQAYFRPESWDDVLRKERLQCGGSQEVGIQILVKCADRRLEVSCAYDQAIGDDGVDERMG